jgi:hypothetical protein
LRRHDEEGVGQGVGLVFDGDLALGHAFEQRALGLRRGAVDLVRQDHLVEDGSRVQFEHVLFALVDRNAENVRRQQVAGELDALVVRADDARDGMRQRGLANARDVLDQQVAACQQAAEREIHLSILAQKDVVDRCLSLLQALQASIVIVHIPLPPRAASPFCRARVYHSAATAGGPPGTRHPSLRRWRTRAARLTRDLRFRPG